MDSEMWQTLGTIAALLVVGGWNGWRTYRAEREAKRAAVHSSTAAEQTASTGNGWAQDVIGRLTRLEESIKATQSDAAATHRLMVDHLADHASHDLS